MKNTQSSIRLFFVRHGNTFEEGQIPVQIGKRTDLPLTSFGILQAEQMGKYLLAEGIRPQAIFAGALKRQMQFASILSEMLHLPLLQEPALTELDYGAWEGLASEEISSRWPKEYKEWNESGIWAENIFAGTEEKHRDCIDLWLSKIRKTFKENSVIVAISSNGLLRLFHKKEKVKTGYFCDLAIYPSHFEIKGWNLKP